MIHLSAVIITYNEEDCIERCILSLKPVVDEIVVLDSFSTDRTKEICISHSVKFIQQPFRGYRDQKNDALRYAKYDYVISLDADEALSIELQQSVQELKKNWQFDAYYCNRYNNFYGQWINHSNCYPDKKIRIFDRRKGCWGGYNLHETVQMYEKATISSVKGDLLHWIYDSYEEHIEKSNKFSTIGAAEYYKAGRKANVFSPFFHSFWMFCKSYIFKKGYKDGFNGFVICTIFAYTCFLKYIKLRKLCIEAKRENYAAINYQIESNLLYENVNS